MGQAKQLKKSKIAIQKNIGANNTQTSHVKLNLNSESIGVSANSAAVNSLQSSESIRRSMITSPGASNSKPKLSSKQKTPKIIQPQAYTEHEAAAIHEHERVMEEDHDDYDEQMSPTMVMTDTNAKSGPQTLTYSSA